MRCKHCKFELSDDATYCERCGKLVASGESFEEEYTVSPALPPEQLKLGSHILGLGIAALACALTLLLSPFGLIFSFATRSTVLEYRKLFLDTTGRATIGKHLGMAGFFASIAMTVLQLTVAAGVAIYFCYF